MKSFAEKIQIRPLRAPAVSTAAFNSQFVAMKNVQWLSFLVQWGAMAGAATSTYAFRPVAATGTATAATDVNLPFKYRLAAAIGTDSWGAVTTVAAGTAVSVTEAQANRALLIELDPQAIPGLHADAQRVYLECVPTGDGATDANYAMSVVALASPRYPQNANLTTVTTT